MSLQPAIQADRHTGQIITWYYNASGQPPVAKPLTGATLVGTITDADGISRAIAGVLTVTDGPNGIFTWAYATADTATVGRYTVQFTATYGDGLPDSSFAMDWEVKIKR